MSFGERLRTERKARGLSLRALARLSGIDYSNISRLERLRSSPLASTAEALANALGVPLAELLTGDPDRASQPLPLVPGMEEHVAATYPVIRRTLLKAGESRKISSIARASRSWAPLVTRGELNLRGAALNLPISAGAMINRDLLVRRTVWAEALVDSELLWIEGAAEPERHAPRHVGSLSGSVVGYFSADPAADFRGTEEELRNAGCATVYWDCIENRSLTRPRLVELLQRVTPGDTIVFPTLADANLRTHEVLELMVGVQSGGARLLTLDGTVDSRRAGFGSLAAALAKLEPNPRSSRVSAGILAAYGGGVQRSPLGGRPPALTRADLSEIHRLLSIGLTNAEIRARLGYAKSTLERYLRQIRQGSPTVLDSSATKKKRIGRPPRLEKAPVEQIRSLVHEGLSAAAIRAQLGPGFSRSTIERCVRRVREGVI